MKCLIFKWGKNPSKDDLCLIKKVKSQTVFSHEWKMDRTKPTFVFDHWQQQLLCFLDMRLHQQKKGRRRVFLTVLSTIIYNLHSIVVETPFILSHSFRFRIILEASMIGSHKEMSSWFMIFDQNNFEFTSSSKQKSCL